MAATDRCRRASCSPRCRPPALRSARSTSAVSLPATGSFAALDARFGRSAPRPLRRRAEQRQRPADALHARRRRRAREPLGHRGDPHRRGRRRARSRSARRSLRRRSRSPAMPECGSRRRASTSASRAATRASPRRPSSALSRALSEASIPDLADFQPSPGARPDESRFAARIAVEEEAKPGASPRAIDSRGDQAVDVAGSYRLTRNLDVTAGVRYSQERDRLAPLPTDAAGQPGGLRRHPVPLLSAARRQFIATTPLRRGFSLAPRQPLTYRSVLASDNAQQQGTGYGARRNRHRRNQGHRQGHLRGAQGRRHDRRRQLCRQRGEGPRLHRRDRHPGLQMGRRRPRGGARRLPPGRAGSRPDRRRWSTTPASPATARCSR